MAKLTMSRRNFVKATAITAAACALASSTTKPLQALAEGVDETAGEVKRVRSCCRACGKVECGVWVTVKDGKAVKVEGDDQSNHSRGHSCSKSQASMQAAYHPDRVRYPVKRTNPKGEDDPGWVRISLAEAFELAGKGLGECVDKYGGQSIFVMCGTSRVWSLGPYQGMKQLFGTPNAHLAYQVCKGPRHFGGIMTDEMGSPWMEVEQEPQVYVQWGTETAISNYDTNNRGVNDVMAHAAHHILVDPRICPSGKEADIWLPLRPGTDGALGLCWLNWIIENEAYDDTMVRRWSNAPFLVVEDKPWLTEGWLVEGNGGIEMKTRLLTEADIKEDGKYQRFMVWDEANERLTYWDAELGKWEGEEHVVPTTGRWIDSPTGLNGRCFLPDESSFADPATEPERFPEGSDECNPEGLPKQPALFPGEIEVELKDGKTYKCRTVWDNLHDLSSQYNLEATEEITGVKAADIELAVKTWTTRIDPDYGNGGIHFQLAPDQNGTGVQNTRILMILSEITGNADEPAGNRGSSKSQFDGNPGRSNMQVGSPYGDEAKVWEGRDLDFDGVKSWLKDYIKHQQDANSPLTELYGTEEPTDEELTVIAKRMGGAFRPSQAWPNPKTVFERNAGEVDAERYPLNRYWSRWVDAGTVWDACCNDRDDIPYALHGGVCQSGDIMNMSNIDRAWEGMTKLDFFVDINLWFCPNNGNADIIFPCWHWLECDTTRVSQGAGGVFGCGQAAIKAPGEAIYDPDWNCGMYRAMGVPWNTRDTEAAPSTEDYITTVAAGSESNVAKWTELLGDEYTNALAGAPSYLWPDHDRILTDNTDAWKTAEFPDGPTFKQAAEKFQNEGWFCCREWHPERWGFYRRHEMCMRRQQGGFNLFPLVDNHPGFMTASGLVEIWSLVCEAYIDEGEWFPVYHEPIDSPVNHPEYYDASLADQIDTSTFLNPGYVDSLKAYPDNTFIMTTGSRQPVYFHSEHRQLPWCRELWPYPRLQMNPNDIERLGLECGQWVWIETPWGKVREVIDSYYGIQQGVVNANHAWWYPEIDTASHGFELVNINCTLNPRGGDPVCGSHNARAVPALVYAATADNSPFGNPVPCDPDGNPVITDASDPRLKQWMITGLRKRVEGEPEWEATEA